MAFPQGINELLAAGYVKLNGGTCGYCCAEITWWQTPRGKKMPIDPQSGVPHFETCTKTLNPSPSQQDMIRSHRNPPPPRIVTPACTLCKTSPGPIDLVLLNLSNSKLVRLPVCEKCAAEKSIPLRVVHVQSAP